MFPFRFLKMKNGKNYCRTRFSQKRESHITFIPTISQYTTSNPDKYLNFNNKEINIARLIVQIKSIICHNKWNDHTHE